MNSLTQELKNKIIDIFHLEDEQASQLNETTPLFEAGIGLDSIDALELSVLLERDYKIKVQDITEGRKIFKNLSSLAEFINSKRHNTNA